MLCQLGHYWLDRAIALGTVAPLDRLGSAWQPLDRQSPFSWSYRPNSAESAKFGDSDATGDASRSEPESQLWAVPYSWSSTAIAYRTDKLGDWRPRDWADLWERPELEGRIVLPDSPRETIGLALKSLGESYNTPRPDRVPGLRDALEALHDRALFYSSTTYQQPLVLGDAWVAIGSSQDIASLPEFGRTIDAIVPASGSALWADLWVQPRVSAESASEERAALVRRWIEFCWQPEIASTLSAVSGAASPGIFAVDRERLPADLRENQLLLPPDDVLAQSEFIQPLASAESIEAYDRLWQAVRSS